MAEIRHLITIDAAPEKVYEAIVRREGLRKWWTADVEGDEKEGSALEFGFFDRSVVYRMRIEKLSPGSEVRWVCETGEEWEGTRVRFALEEDDGKTVLRFSHSDWREETDYFLTCNTTWGDLMYRLKAVAEGGEPGPLFSRDGLNR